MSRTALTAVVYQHPGIKVEYDKQKDFYRVVAIDDIPSFTAVLCEHVIWGHDSSILSTSIGNDEKLYKQLYPRHQDTPKFQSGPAFDSVVEQKLKLNAFRFNDIDIIGAAISKFNTSCNPNTLIAAFDSVNEHKFYGAYTLKKLSKGEELYVNYYDMESWESHEKYKKKYECVCECTPVSLPESRKRYKIQTNIINTLISRERAKWIPLVDDYMETKDAAKRSKFQETIRDALGGGTD